MDPTTNDIRYVGQTNNINRRYNTHIASSWTTPLTMDIG